jgi:hypothetical protein
MVGFKKAVNLVKESVFMVVNVMNADNVVVQVYATMKEGSHDAKNVVGMLVVSMAFAKIVSYVAVLLFAYMP